MQAAALQTSAGLDVTAADLEAVVARTFLRGYAAERRQGFGTDDYRLPAEAHLPLEHSTLGYFNTPDFFAQVQTRVMAVLDRRALDAGFSLDPAPTAPSAPNPVEVEKP